MSEPATIACASTDAGGLSARARSAAGKARTMLLGSGDRATDGRNALLAFAVRIASAGILFVSQVALARWMGVDQFGIYVYAWTLVLVLGAISTAGLNIGAIRIVSELRERGSLDALRGFLRASRLLVLAVSVLLTALALGSLWLFSRSMAPAVWLTIAIILAAVPAYALTDLQDGTCRGGARMASALFAPYILRPLLILGGVGGMHLAGLPLDATLAALAAVAATWIAWGLQSLIVARDFGRLLPRGSRTYDLPGWAVTSAPLLLMGVFDLAMQNIDVIVIANLLTPADAAIYFAGAKTMALILFVHYAVGSAMSNRFAALATRGDTAALRLAVRDAVRWTFWPSLVIAIVMLALGEHLLALFGPRFAAGYPVMCILALAIMARAAIGPAESLLNMTGGQRDCARTLMIAALSNLTLSLILTPRYGILGAAVAVSAAMTLGACLNWRAVHRNLGIDAGVWSELRRRRAVAQPQN